MEDDNLTIWIWMCGLVVIVCLLGFSWFSFLAATDAQEKVFRMCGQLARMEGNGLADAIWITTCKE